MTSSAPDDRQRAIHAGVEAEGLFLDGVAEFGEEAGRRQSRAAAAAGVPASRPCAMSAVTSDRAPRGGTSYALDLFRRSGTPGGGGVALGKVAARAASAVIRPADDQRGEVLLEGLHPELRCPSAMSPSGRRCARFRAGRRGPPASRAAPRRRPPGPGSSCRGRSCCATMRAEALGEAHAADLALLPRQHGEDPLDGGRDVGRRHRGDDEAPGLGRLDRGVDGLGVGDLADHHHVGVLPERGAEARRIGVGVDARPRAGSSSR